LLRRRVSRIGLFAALVVFLCFLSVFVFKNNHVGGKIRNRGSEQPSRRYREERRMEWRMKTLIFWVVTPCSGVQVL
jgi:hypothetical protein